MAPFVRQEQASAFVGRVHVESAIFWNQPDIAYSDFVDSNYKEIEGTLQLVERGIDPSEAAALSRSPTVSIAIECARQAIKERSLRLVKTARVC